ncbi:MAG TPA: hypothetical protein VHP11_15980 [Tepidisphaeraceae bacterium]|nr:hypothetical protein [Tepidisphaeraceae bacterium]
MDLVRAGRIVLGQSLVVLLLACATSQAQDGGQAEADASWGGQLYTSSSPIAVPDPQKIIPVRVLREFELGTELERFASTTSRLLETREKELGDAIWKVDGRTTVTPVAIVVRDAIRRTERRLGARLDFRTTAEAGTQEQRLSHILDLDELKQMEVALNEILKALDQAPSKGETIALRYRSRSGFAVSLVLSPKGDQVAVNAAVGQVSGDTTEQARRMFEETATVVHRLVNYLSSY